MNCRRAKSVIALWAGQDLEESAERHVERHLAECPHCRSHWQRMQKHLQLLRDAGDDDDPPLTSVWPGVAERIAPGREGTARFNGWVPAVAVAGFVLAMVSIVRDETATTSQSVLPTHPVSFPEPASPAEPPPENRPRRFPQDQPLLHPDFPVWRGSPHELNSLESGQRFAAPETRRIGY